MFQSTHPRGVRLRNGRPQRRTYQGFNPRTRVGCDQRPGHRQRGSSAVSIHAPAWGATYPCQADRTGSGVSIHAPAWGATCRLSHAAASRCRCFNPRTRVGCDLCQGGQGIRGRMVSIHAPAWGATAKVSTMPSSSKFQSTHASGERRRGCAGCGTWRCGFNPRTRVGCDLVVRALLVLSVCFNPRTRVGCDPRP